MNKNQTKTFTLCALPYFENDVKRICTLDVSTLCVCDRIKTIDILNKIVEHEMKDVNENSGYVITLDDVYSVDNLKYLSDMIVDDEFYDEYKIQREFVDSHKIICIFGIDADESDIYILIEE